VAFHVYILRCADGSYYAGHTDNLESRIAAHHHSAILGFTSTRRPVKLVFSEQFQSRADAIGREKQIKRWSRAKKQALINSDWNRLTELSKSGGSTSSPRTGQELKLSLMLEAPNGSLQPCWIPTNRSSWACRRISTIEVA